MRTPATLLAILAALLAVPGAPRAADGETSSPARVVVVKGDLSLAILADPDASTDAAGLILREGRIAGWLARDAEPPAGAVVLDYGDAHLLPGLIDACALTADARRDPPFATTPEARAIDGFDPYGRPDDRLADGVTAMWLSPSRGRLLTGLGALVRTAGDDRVLAAEAGLRATLGREGLDPPAFYEPPLYPDPFGDPIRPALPPPPSTRAAATAMLREALGEGAEGTLLAAREGRLRVRLHANDADEIRLAVRLAKETGVRAVLELGDAAAAREALHAIRASGFPVVLEEGGPDAAAVLAALPDAALGRPGSGSVLALAASAARDGRDVRALRAVTIDAARALGVEDRIGSLDAGKDADLVVVDGDPLAPGVSIRAVLIGGRVVHERHPAPGLLAIRAARLLDGTGAVLEDAVVLCRDGRILSVDAHGVFPPDAERLELAGTVVPGMIDAWSYAGVPGGDLTVPAADAVLPDGDALARLRAHGVTSCVLVPRGGGVRAGLVSVASTTLERGELRTVRRRAGLLVNLATGGDRAERALAFRDLLAKARAYVGAWTAHEKAVAAAEGESGKPPAAPKRDVRLEPWRAVVAGDLPLLVRAERTEEVREALDVPDALGGGRVVVLGGAGGVRIAGDVAERGVPVFLAGLPSIRLEGGGLVPAPRELARAGVAVALGSGGCRADPVAMLGEAIRQGLSPRAALAAVTVVPAEALGVGDRVGRIAPGLAADLVELSDGPGAPGCHVLRVVVGGRVVHERKDAR